MRAGLWLCSSSRRSARRAGVARGSRRRRRLGLPRLAAGRKGALHFDKRHAHTIRHAANGIQGGPRVDLHLEPGRGVLRVPPRARGQDNACHKVRVRRVGRAAQTRTRALSRARRQYAERRASGKPHAPSANTSKERLHG